MLGWLETDQIIHVLVLFPHGWLPVALDVMLVANGWVPPPCVGCNNRQRCNKNPTVFRYRMMMMTESELSRSATDRIEEGLSTDPVVFARAVPSLRRRPCNS